MDVKEPREDRRQEPIPGEYGFPIPKELLYRELGFGGFSGFHNFPRHNSGRKVVSQLLSTKAVHSLCTKDLSQRKFNLPTGARTTFHIAFSADGTKVASCHGDHNVYVCDVSSGDLVQTLTGHPRTPWCVVFHPTQSDVLASGCLAGHVRVWDLKGGSELLVTDSGTVIASLAFHPSVRLLAIATFNEIIFWDWGHQYPMARCSTENTKEKVRLVRFDSLGRSLITGITNFPSPPTREEVRRPVRGGNAGAMFRPNILSRHITVRRRRFSPTFSRSEMSRDENVEDVAMDTENEVVEEEIVPDSEVSAEAEAFAVAAAVAADDDPLIVGESLSARQDRFQESYRQLVSHYQELVSNYQQFLRSRIPRILDETPSSSAQDREPLPPETITPDILSHEVEVHQIDESFVPESLPSTSTSIVPDMDNDSSSEHITTLESPSSPTPTVMDDEVPGPSRLLFETHHRQDQDQDMTSDPLALDELDRQTSLMASAIGNDEPTATTSTESASPNSSTGRNGGRSETDLRSIEALAQNILEMQNLCSQVRMDAPLAVENQHVVELRVIRRHLELLQEQTRDLQSSIRATLNSLATGSLAAIRSHLSNGAGAQPAPIPDSEMGRTPPSITHPFINLEHVTPPQPNGPGPGLGVEFEPMTHSPPLSPTIRVNPQPLDAFPASTITTTSRRVRAEPATTITTNSSQSSSSSSSRNSPEGNGSANTASALYRIMLGAPYSESNRTPNAPLLNRIRVPPMVAMQYETPEGTRNQNHSQAGGGPGPSASRNVEEGTSSSSAGSASSRDASASNSTSGNNGRRRDPPSTLSNPRRVVREFHVVTGPGRPGTFVAEEHARHCPFSGRDPYHWRPPPRMRSLYDMGEMPPLIAWPTMETGLESSTRSFRAVTTSPQPSTSQRIVRTALRPNITITVRNGLGMSFNMNSNDVFGSNNSSSRSEPFITFSEWILGSGIGLGNLTNDVFVGIYLTIRQLSERSPTGEAISTEQWQRTFQSTIPLFFGQPLQTQRYHRRRRAHWICYNHMTAPPTSITFNMSRGGAGSSPGAGGGGSSPDESSQSSTSSSGSTSSGGNRNNNQNQPPSTSASTGQSPQNRAPNEPGLHVFAPGVPPGVNLSYLTDSSRPSSRMAAFCPAHGTKLPPGVIRPIPHQLLSNFSRVFYIRAAEELIPVYSTVHSTETVLGTEVRESLQVNVYYLPIGLFLQGGPWETNTQTIGIHWPPVTREEEYAILDLRMSDRPLEVHTSPVRESMSNGQRFNHRIRVDYDQYRLWVTLPTGFCLYFIQAGLTLLDCISTSVNLPRPRPLSGTVWIDYFGTFLDALERTFGLRHARRSLGPIPTGHRAPGAYLGRAPPWFYGPGMRPPQPPNYNPIPQVNVPPTPASASASGSQSQRQASERNNVQITHANVTININGGNNGTNGNNSTDRSDAGNIGNHTLDRSAIFATSRRGGSNERQTRRIITHAVDSFIDGTRRRMYDDNQMMMSHGFMYDDNGTGFRSYLGRGADNRRFYFRERHGSPSWMNHPSQNQGDGQREGGDGGRFIRLAVDTAASEVLRRNRTHHHHHHHHHHPSDMNHSHGVLQESQNGLPVVEAGSAGGFSTIGRPVESRIERVLNERGNRGAHSPTPSGGVMDEASRNRMRLEEIQMRISMFSQWSRARAMATSGTQTPHRSNWPVSSSTQTPTAGRQQSANMLMAERVRSRTEQRRQAMNFPGPSSSGGVERVGAVEIRIGRRRPYSRIARYVPPEGEGDSDDDVIMTVPARIPRLNDPRTGDYIGLRRERAEAAGSSAREGGRLRSNVDHWVLRAASTPFNNQSQRYRTPSVLEVSGSARTRASPLNRNPQENGERDGNAAEVINEPEPPRLPGRISRRGGILPLPGFGRNNDGNNNNLGGNGEEQNADAGARQYPGYIPEILIAPRHRATYYQMDAATTAFLSSRIQKWDFTEFLIPDITKRDESVVVRECSLHSDACLDVSSDSEFLAVLQPSGNGSYSSIGLYSLRDESLGECLSVFHFDQNTVSISISPSCDYLVVGYAGRGPLYRFVHPSRNIGKILSLTRDEEVGYRMVPVKDIYADGQVAFMSINCMHWVPVAGYGIIYGTNTGELILLS